MSLKRKITSYAEKLYKLEALKTSIKDGIKDKLKKVVGELEMNRLNIKKIEQEVTKLEKVYKTFYMLRNSKDSK